MIEHVVPKQLATFDDLGRDCNVSGEGRGISHGVIVSDDWLQTEAVTHGSLDSLKCWTTQLACGCRRETLCIQRADLEAEEDGFHR